MDSKNKYCVGDVVVLRSEVYRFHKDELNIRTSSFNGYATVSVNSIPVNKSMYRVVGKDYDYIYYFARILEIKLKTDKQNEYKCYSSISRDYQWAYENDIVCNTDFKDLRDAMFNSDVSMYIDNKEKSVEKESSVLVEQKISTKDSRKVLFENDSCILEKRNNRYYFSLYNEETGEFIREISIYVKDNGKVSIAQYA